MEKKEPTLEELLALAAKPANPKEDVVLDDVSEWIMREAIKPGDYKLRRGTAYQLYHRWSVAPYQIKKFAEIMNKKFDNNKMFYFVEEASVEEARARVLSEIGDKRRAQQYKKSKRKI